MYFADEPEHITLLRQSMRAFVAREMPREKVREWERACEFQPDLLKKLAATGVCGVTISEEFGGSGRDIVAAVAIIDELCRGGSAAAGPFIHCAFYGGLNISENGSDAQKRELLPKLARGELLMAYGLTEPDVGGDLASVSTSARQSADGKQVVIYGTKRWCTGAGFADYIVCLCNSDPKGKRYKNLTMVLVPTSLPGITIENIEHMGLRYAPSTDVLFGNVEVPIENILGGPDAWNDGWRKLAGPSLDIEKLEITAVALGITECAVADAWQYAQERVQFGRPISGHQAVRHDLADLRTQLQACRHMLYHAAWLANEGRPCSVEASMAKLFVADTGVRIVQKCQEIMGSYGCSPEYDMERYMRDILLMPIVGGSSNMQRNNIAARLKLAE